MVYVESQFGQNTTTEEESSSESPLDFSTQSTAPPASLSSLLGQMGADPARNLARILDFGPKYLGCERLSYSKFSPDQPEEPLNENSLAIQLKDAGKLLLLHNFSDQPNDENLSIFTSLLAQQECRLRDYLRMTSLEAYTQKLFEACPDGIVVTDDHGFILNANRAMIALTRKPLETLIGLRVSQLADSSGRAEAFKALRRLKSNSRSRFDCRVSVGAGRTVPASISFTDFQFQGKTLILATVRDLSDLEDEVTLCTTYEQSLSRSIDNATDGFIRYDQFGRITEANPYTEKLSGHSPLRLIGRPVDDLLTVSSLRKFRKAVAKLQETGYATFSAEVAHTDGSARPVNAVLMQLELEGERFCRLFLQDREKLAQMEE
ncbi:PAS domain S-box protein [Roseibacillus persicicus]|uniref:PAS domain-containing protein n=1 Tax=Roseibacillus persicicus TaxID=454148 RepID=UPI00398B4A27